MLFHLIFGAIFCLLGSLGLLVIHSKPKKKVNRIFFVWVIFIILWLASNYLENAPLGLKWNNLFLRLDFAFGPFLTYFFLLFALNFPESQKYKYFTKIILLPALFFSFLSFFSSHIIQDTQLIGSKLFFKLGPLFWADAVFTLIYFVGGILKWILDYKSLKGLKKLQLLYIFLGVLISGIIILIANLFLQRIIYIRYFQLANFSIIFFVAFTAHAIIKHHLFDIRIVIQKTILYALTFGVFLATYLSLIYLLGKFFALMALAPTISSIISSFLIFSFYSRFKLYFHKKTDKFFYHYPYDA
ncbi:MAG: hypothetical protein NTW06_01400, partial [Candidatus Falkowbacteria bacterium]|nr:hypothetical protein [Candidatus Falkowbacteria bacterium]